jgi:hypothetical protein
MQAADASELVNKWLATGFLRGVKQHQLQRAAERLEAAHRSTAGGHNRDALDRELAALGREGFFPSKHR